MPRWTPLLLAVSATAALSGCSGGGADDVARPAPTTTFTAGDVPVLVPGAPGESPAVVAPGESGELANPGAYGDADVEFVTGMVPHHAQALRMAELVPDRAQDPRVRALADRISAGQGPEIEAMQAWLAEQGLPAADEEIGHGGHSGMQAMLAPEQIARLVAARGADFDRMFLELMTAHHQGALEMAEQAGGAQHPVVSEMVKDTVATQSVEIAQMQEVLRDLQG